MRDLEGRPARSRLYGALAVALSLSAFGELVGYAFGPGGAVEGMSRMELDRRDAVRPDD
jgi:hypothetical protein